jgi:hypothetical protein
MVVAGSACRGAPPGASVTFAMVSAEEESRGSGVEDADESGASLPGGELLTATASGPAASPESSDEIGSTDPGIGLRGSVIGKSGS